MRAMVWIRNLIVILLWAGFAAAVRPVSGVDTSWGIFVFGLLLLLFWHVKQLQRVNHWTLDLAHPPPPSAGSWDEALARIYRHLRNQERHMSHLESNVQGFFAAAQAMPDGLVTLDHEFHIDWCNRNARVHLGLHLPTDRGHNIINLIRNPAFVEYVRQKEWPTSLLLKGAGQGERTLQVQVVSYGRGQHMLLTRDVTQLTKLETTRQDFVANVSHELRTPLTVLSGFLETLQDLPPEALSEEQRKQYFDMMSAQAKRMEAIVADLLTLSTLESSPTHDPQPVQMRMLIQTALNQAEALSNGRHHLTHELEDGINILGTQTELASAISNLLTNAVRYTPDGGSIHVTWKSTSTGQAVYTVKDTGIGISAQHLPRLTERFYRVDRSRSRESGGTGLGLAITKHIAQRHNADLLIESEEQRGSKFSLVFPSSRVAGHNDE